MAGCRWSRPGGRPIDETGAPFRLTVSVYPADRNQFAVNVGQVPKDRYPACRGWRAVLDTA